MSLAIPGVDYAWSKPDPAGLKKDGIKFVMRYLSHDASKNLTLSELARLKARGIAVGLVWESSAARAMSGSSGGTSDAKAAAVQAKALGLSKLPIYFAVDFDASDIQKPTIMNYLEGAASVLGPDRVGVYGGYWVIKYVVEHNGPVHFPGSVCKWFWQTYAWSGGKIHPSAHIYQYKNGINAHGGNYDLNKARDDVPCGLTMDFSKHTIEHKKAPLKQRLQWRSNVRVLDRIIKNHPGWPSSDLDVLYRVRVKYQNAIKRGWV